MQQREAAHSSTGGEAHEAQAPASSSSSSSADATQTMSQADERGGYTTDWRRARLSLRQRLSSFLIQYPSEVSPSGLRGDPEGGGGSSGGIETETEGGGGGDSSGQDRGEGELGGKKVIYASRFKKGCGLYTHSVRLRFIFFLVAVLIIAYALATAYTAQTAFVVFLSLTNDSEAAKGGPSHANMSRIRENAYWGMFQLPAVALVLALFADTVCSLIGDFSEKTSPGKELRSAIAATAEVRQGVALLRCGYSTKTSAKTALWTADFFVPFTFEFVPFLWCITASPGRGFIVVGILRAYVEGGCWTSLGLVTVYSVCRICCEVSPLVFHIYDRSNLHFWVMCRIVFQTYFKRQLQILNAQRLLLDTYVEETILGGDGGEMEVEGGASRSTEGERGGGTETELRIPQLRLSALFPDARIPGYSRDGGPSSSSDTETAALYPTLSLNRAVPKAQQKKAYQRPLTMSVVEEVEEEEEEEAEEEKADTEEKDKRDSKQEEKSSGEHEGASSSVRARPETETETRQHHRLSTNSAARRATEAPLRPGSGRRNNRKSKATLSLSHAAAPLTSSSSRAAEEEEEGSFKKRMSVPARIAKASGIPSAFLPPPKSPRKDRDGETNPSPLPSPRRTTLRLAGKKGRGRDEEVGRASVRKSTSSRGRMSQWGTPRTVFVEDEEVGGEDEGASASEKRATAASRPSTRYSQYSVDEALSRLAVSPSLREGGEREEGERERAAAETREGDSDSEADSDMDSWVAAALPLGADRGTADSLEDEMPSLGGLWDHFCFFCKDISWAAGRARFMEWLRKTIRRNERDSREGDEGDGEGDEEDEEHANGEGGGNSNSSALSSPVTATSPSPSPPLGPFLPPLPSESETVAQTQSEEMKGRRTTGGSRASTNQVRTPRSPTAGARARPANRWKCCNRVRKKLRKGYVCLLSAVQLWMTNRKFRRWAYLILAGAIYLCTLSLVRNQMTLGDVILLLVLQVVGMLMCINGMRGDSRLGRAFNVAICVFSVTAILIILAASTLASLEDPGAPLVGGYRENPLAEPEHPPVSTGSPAAGEKETGRGSESRDISPPSSSSTTEEGGKGTIKDGTGGTEGEGEGEGEGEETKPSDEIPQNVTVQRYLRGSGGTSGVPQSPGDAIGVPQTAPSSLPPMPLLFLSDVIDYLARPLARSLSGLVEPLRVVLREAGSDPDENPLAVGDFDLEGWEWEEGGFSVSGQGEENIGGLLGEGEKTAVGEQSREQKAREDIVKARKFRQGGHQLCQLRWGYLSGLNFLDLGWLAYTSYNRDALITDMTEVYFGKVLDDSFDPEKHPKTPFTPFEVLSVEPQPLLGRALVVDFPLENVLVIAYRGTQVAAEAIADLDVWSAAFIVQTISRYFLPILAWLPPELVPNMLWAITQSNEVLRRQILLVGHSMGGAVATIVGAKTSLPAITISAPGVLMTRKRFGVDEGRVQRGTLSVFAMGDPVPTADIKSGLIGDLGCSSKSPKTCHMAIHVLCDLFCTGGYDRRGMWWKACWHTAKQKKWPDANQGRCQWSKMKTLEDAREAASLPFE
uniref:Fungal lipase-type domain-containing protein n=1 Tax=Chromera velia CCMP2878 TaxID=1169474 RepID=A0A0G4HBJ4_9ALVE|eukprot:Cvel_6140.t1-p1 / transcript=Cvel_6140.t1 / gene=Cvel_6140 / organism=Chromera_velia_CCMP2878 / gene_product=hypothetical protein / transcript_product=hypothetical protein / location=Cvel_scaffold297:4204-18652(+) / protein_length=1550 / sequence_SO=supercontig / SO=protein_coding / is_pseudo=false